MPRPPFVYGKMSLEEALRSLCRHHGCDFVSIRTKGRCEITVTYKEPGPGYHSMLIKTDKAGTLEEVDDALYETAARLFASEYPIVLKT